MVRDYWVFQSEDVILAKLGIIAVIHACLFLLVAEGGIRQKSKKILWLPQSFMLALLPHYFNRIVAAALVGVLIASCSLLLMNFTSVSTMMIANAAFLTLWYVECAILLSRGFFHRLFEGEIPPEITLFISFIVMVNAGYFTLMFLVSILRAPSF